MAKGYLNNATFSRGDRYFQLFHIYPVLEPILYPFSFEKNYDPEPVLDSMSQSNYAIPLIAIALYGVFCYFGQKFMEQRPPLDLKLALATWNLFLSFFSFYGMIRMVPQTLYVLSHKTFEETICTSAHIAYGSGATGLATQLFIISKIPELLDTVFIVLRKKRLIFLHWYHHVTVLLFCWNAYVTESAAGHYFVSMNYTVHFVMYSYFFLQAIRAVPKWFPSVIITTLQIAQMVIGTVVVFWCFYYHLFGGKYFSPGRCHNQVSNLIAGGVIYSSYLFLFVDFAIRRYTSRRNESSGGGDEMPKKSY